MKNGAKTRLPQTPITPTKTSKQTKYDTLCVCQICTCGKHRCPTKKHIPFSSDTTYHHDYKPCPGIINQIKRGPPSKFNERHYNPQLLKTTYDIQYQPHKLEKQVVDPNTKTVYKPKHGKFHSQTQYNKNYNPKQLPFQTPPPAKYNTLKPTKFQGTTTYVTQFVPKTAENFYPPRNNGYTPKKLPFEGKTTYNTQYKNYPIQQYVPQCDNCGRNKNRCQCQHSPFKGGKFQGQTNYKQSYQPYELQRNIHCPIMDLPEPPRQCTPGKNHINYNARKNTWY